MDRDIIPSTVENLNTHAIHKLRECSWNTRFGVTTLLNEEVKRQTKGGHEITKVTERMGGDRVQQYRRSPVFCTKMMNHWGEYRKTDLQRTDGDCPDLLREKTSTNRYFVELEQTNEIQREEFYLTKLIKSSDKKNTNWRKYDRRETAELLFGDYI